MSYLKLIAAEENWCDVQFYYWKVEYEIIFFTSSRRVISNLAVNVGHAVSSVSWRTRTTSATSRTELKKSEDTEDAPGYNPILSTGHQPIPPFYSAAAPRALHRAPAPAA